MSRFTIRLIVIAGVLAIASVLGLQAYWLYKSYKLQDREFDEHVKIALRKVAESISALNKTPLPKRGLIKKETSNYYVINVNSYIDAQLLEYSLYHEFKELDILIPFEYAVYDCNTNELVFGNCCTIDKPKKPKDKSKTKKAERIDLTYYFVVRFPDRDSFFSGTNLFALIFSGFSLLACLIFGYTILIVLKQKRYQDMVRDFVNNMTHEFKTPISSIKLAADVLTNSDTILADKRLSQYAKIIKDQNQRLNDQVEKVLQIAKTESSTFTIKKEAIDLHVLIDELSQAVNMQVQSMGGSIHLDLQATPCVIQGDKFHLTNVLTNLLDNAVKYRKEHPVIEIKTSNLPNKKLKLEIVDQGIGLKEEDLQRVFEKFYRVSTGNVHNVKGFGIGLFYVKRICDIHDWPVEIKSEYQKSTTVSIIFDH